MVFCCFLKWSVEHSQIRILGYGRPYSREACQDRRIAGAAVAASREEIRHMLHLLCHQGSSGTVCLQQNSDHVSLCPGYHLHHDTDKHGYYGVVKESTGEWSGALLSLVLRVVNVCMRVMYVQVYSLTTNTPYLRFHVVGGNNLQIAVFL